jgi:phosphate-selective porin OprO/OprP
MKWISTATLLVALGFGMSGSRATAQQAGDVQMPDDINARLEKQEKEIGALRAQLAGLQQGTPVTPTGYALADTTAAPAAPAAPAPYEVGSDMSGIAFFRNGEFLNFSTPNKDFTMHLGGWVQYDNVWWNNPAALTSAKGGANNNTSSPALASGVAGGGIGALSDGDSWRRLRIVQEGTFWETGEYRFNWAFENNQFSTAGLDEMWMGYNKIPLIGTVRVGHVKTPMGLEGDMVSSSRCMTFMERSSYSQAIELDQNFGTGIWFGNSFLDDNMTYSFSAFRPDTVNGASSAFYGDGQAGIQSRVTVLPFYEDEGRHMLHLGLSGGWRDGSSNSNSTSYTGNTVDLRSRPELRDDVPAGNLAGSLSNVNDNRLIDSGVVACNQEYLLGTELLYIRGPFSAQLEYGWNFLNDAQGIASTSTAAHPVLLPMADYMFNGGYVQFAYTLTGENRAYDKKNGSLARYYFGSQGPYENAFLVKDANGGLCSGHGAWEVAVRFSHTDLNSNVLGERIQGGDMNGVDGALNWYMNTNFTVMMDVVYNSRYDVPASTIPGDVVGCGMRVQYSF